MTACKWAGSNRRRVVADEHYDGCEDAGCQGCWPCMEDHCLVCGVKHTADVCATCVGAARDDLNEIRDLCHQLRPQAAVTGLRGERPETVMGGDAMVAIAMRYGDQNGRAGTWHDDWVSDESDADITPPIVVLVGWEDVWRDHLGHHTEQTATVGKALTYLGDQLTYMATVLDVPFADFAGDIRRLRGRLQSVVHDQNRGDPAGVACFDCGGDLERKLLKRRSTGANHQRDVGGFEDLWTCVRCRRKYTYAEYNFALRAKLEDANDHKESA